MGFDSTNMATNGVPTQLLPSPLGASAYQRAFSATASPYQSALQATPWLHQGPPQYIMQPQMIPSNMDPNAGIQYSSLMHHLSAQMSHLQLGGVSGTGVCFRSSFNNLPNTTNSSKKMKNYTEYKK